MLRLTKFGHHKTNLFVCKTEKKIKKHKIND
jgi:hypothetical protein